jgi:hypothetical protein
MFFFSLLKMVSFKNSFSCVEHRRYYSRELSGVRSDTTRNLLLCVPLVKLCLSFLSVEKLFWDGEGGAFLPVVPLSLALIFLALGQ